MAKNQVRFIWFGAITHLKISLKDFAWKDYKLARKKPEMVVFGMVETEIMFTTK